MRESCVSVIPAKAGIHFDFGSAGGWTIKMDDKPLGLLKTVSGFRRDDGIRDQATHANLDFDNPSHSSAVP
jgi:hypothetical protein